MFAVIQTGGKQYKVIEQDIIFVEKLDVNEGDEIVFDSVKALSSLAANACRSKKRKTVAVKRRFYCYVLTFTREGALFRNYSLMR